ncbi:hypothetical protein SAY86_000923 [Trapa natans]|uniref:Uncharacterized protein n=1 Tax=Trapa natans TaxID=22666 RepID=A0AAN7MV78_TRANT|nr:hypothetical protein SAY86_000923 [Trapa natans]
MVLIISVKSASEVGWFSEKEKQDLFTLFDYIRSFFYNPRDIRSGTNDSLSAFSTIFSRSIILCSLINKGIYSLHFLLWVCFCRFYPHMRMGNIIASVEVKPGYGTFLKDFLILKDMGHSPEERIRLLVARTDDMNTSACITSPIQVKSGSKLTFWVIQGHYIIALALMRVTSPINSIGLEDYVSPTIITVQDSDSDLIEGPSRISLICPIGWFNSIQLVHRQHPLSFIGFRNQHLQRALNNNRPPPTGHHLTTPSPRYSLRCDQSPHVQTQMASAALLLRFHIPFVSKQIHPIRSMFLNISEPPSLQ